METNNYIESWHNQLKTIYLRRKQNQRVDRLLFILVNDVEPSYIRNVEHLTMNVGRMGPEERNRRRRQIEAERVLEESLPSMVDASNAPLVYNVMSFANEGVWYEVRIEDNGMVSCSCADFGYMQNACKHMFLLHRLYIDLLSYQKTFQEISFSPVNVDPSEPEVVRERAPQVDVTVPLARNSNIMSNIANLQAVLRAYTENPYQLNKSELNSFRTGLQLMLDSLSSNTNVSAPNVNMRAQRR